MHDNVGKGQAFISGMPGAYVKRLKRENKSVMSLESLSRFHSSLKALELHCLI